MKTIKLDAQCLRSDCLWSNLDEMNQRYRNTVAINLHVSALARRKGNQYCRYPKSDRCTGGASSKGDAELLTAPITNNILPFTSQLSS